MPHVATRRPRSPVLVALVHETMNGRPFDSLGDLTEAVKRRAATLRIPYDSGQVAAAIDAVSHTRSVGPPVATRRVERLDPERGPSREDAAAILERLYAEVERRR